MIETLQQEDVMSANAIAQEAREQPPVKRVKRSSQQQQSRLQLLA
jgi:hypothetical protein